VIRTPLVPFKLQLLDGSLMPMGHGRPAGMHQSTIVAAMKAAAGESVSPIAGEDPDLRPQMGFLWERAADLVWLGVPWQVALETAWKEYMAVAKVGPPERGPVETQLRVACDGILGTPDGWDRGGRTLESYKLTWKSMRKWEEDPEEHFAYWLVGERGYLWSLHSSGYPVFGYPAAGLATVRFFIFWGNGDYSRKPGRGPQATFTDLSFTYEELEENWRTILRWRDIVEARKREAA
jgi:hypothetical protein